MTHEWSAQQQNVFDYFLDDSRKHAVVIARAGTGKTTTIVEAVRQLLEKLPETKILVCAFNKSIQIELQSRLPANADCATFHSLGLRSITSARGKVGIKTEREKQLVLAALPADPPYDLVNDIKKLVSLCMNTLSETDTEISDLMNEHGITPFAGIETQHYIDWAKKVLKASIDEFPEISFDQMVYIPAKMGWKTGNYDFVIVDETQDMNKAQLKLGMQALKEGGRFVAVGDPAQAIYAFRAADSGSIGRIQKELDAEVLKLSITYRCPKNVVSIANEFVPDLEAAPTAPYGSVEHASESEFIAGVRGGDFVLSRTNAPLVTYCLKLLKSGKPAYIQGREVGGTLKTLIKKARRSSIIDLSEWLKDWSNREVMRLKALDKEDKIDEVRDRVEVIVALSEGLSTTQQLYNRIDSLFEDADPSSRVMFSSVHKAKGLEANTVWCLNTTFRPGKNAEEDNICYVAYTRSKNRLVLVDAPAKKVHK